MSSFLNIQNIKECLLRMWNIYNSLLYINDRRESIRQSSLFKQFRHIRVIYFVIQFSFHHMARFTWGYRVIGVVYFFVLSYCQRLRTLSRSNRPWYIHIWASGNCLPKTLHIFFFKKYPFIGFELGCILNRSKHPLWPVFTTLPKHFQLHALEEGPWIEKLIYCSYFYLLLYNNGIGFGAI